MAAQPIHPVDEQRVREIIREELAAHEMRRAEQLARMGAVYAAAASTREGDEDVC